MNNNRIAESYRKEWKIINARRPTWRSFPNSPSQWDARALTSSVECCCERPNLCLRKYGDAVLSEQSGRHAFTINPATLEAAVIDKAGSTRRASIRQQGVSAIVPGSMIEDDPRPGKIGFGHIIAVCLDDATVPFNYRCSARPCHNLRWWPGWG